MTPPDGASLSLSGAGGETADSSPCTPDAPAPYPAPPYGKSGGGSTLPGSGEAPPGCGNLLVTHVCTSPHVDGKARARVVRQECRDRTCPHCAGRCADHCPVHLPPHPGGTWAHRGGVDAASRWEDYLEQHCLDHTQVRQVVVSVPPDRFPESCDHSDLIRRLRATSEKLVSRWAWRSATTGGTAVVHLYRGCEGDYSRWGPHVHLTCLGIRTGEVANYQAKYGVVVKQVTNRDGRWASYRGKALSRHLVYELGHASFSERGHALTWWGDLHAWRQPEEPHGPSSVPACPECSEPMREAIWTHEVTGTFKGPALYWMGCDGAHVLPVVLVPGPPVRLGRA